MVYQVTKTRVGVCQEIAEKITAEIAKEQANSNKEGTACLHYV